VNKTGDEAEDIVEHWQEIGGCGCEQGEGEACGGGCGCVGESQQ